MSATVYLAEANGLPKLSSIQTLGPSTRCTATYLNEGGANFVFKLTAHGGEPLPHAISGKLLRLRKDLTHVQNTKEQLYSYEQNFKTLFPPDNLVEHELIQLDDGLPYVLNDALKRLNRPSHRAQDFLSQEERYGLLVTDMTPQLGDVLVQLKPKWLAQSPSAPSNAKRCRTCALRAQRASQQIRTATDAQESCPLDLVSEWVEDRKRAANRATADRRLQEYLVNQAQPLLRCLLQHQRELDVGGTLGASNASAIFSLCKAMTLRDCTLFLKRSGGSVEARLGDLDLKQPEKLARWKQVEQSLIRDGWYANTEDRGSWAGERICLLSR